MHCNVWPDWGRALQSDRLDASKEKYEELEESQELEESLNGVNKLSISQSKISPN